MWAQITRLQHGKSEHTLEPDTCQDRLKDAPEVGLFAVADGAGTTSFPRLWAGVLVEQFVALPLVLAGPDPQQAPVAPGGPFEVEWWVRQAQARYEAERPGLNRLDYTAREKEIKKGSESTLVTLRLTRIAGGAAEGVLLAFGDSCAFVLSPRLAEEAFTFPLKDVREFERPPICVPSNAGVFHRNFHRCSQEVVHLEVGSVVILATDAVAKWMMSKGNGGCGSIREACQVVQRHKPGEEWAAFIQECRRQKAMIDDDCTALVIEFLEDIGTVVDVAGSLEAGAAALEVQQPPHSEAVKTRRWEEFTQARGVPDPDWETMAVAWGDGVDLADWLARGEVTQAEIEQARTVADALKEVIATTVAYQNKPDFVPRARAVWAKHRDVLEREPRAASIRKTLQARGVFEGLPAAGLPAPGPAIAASPGIGLAAPAVPTPPPGGGLPAALPGLLGGGGLRLENAPLGAALAVPSATPPAVPGSAPVPGAGAPPGVAGSPPPALTETGRLREEVRVRDQQISVLELRERFARLLATDDDEALLDVCEQLRAQGHPPTNPQDRARVQLAEQRWAPLKYFRKLLQLGASPAALVEAFQAAEPGNKQRLTTEEQAQVQLAARFLAAWQRGDDQALLSAYTDLYRWPNRAFLRLSADQQSRLDGLVSQSGALVLNQQQQAQALRDFRAARDGRQLHSIAAAFRRLTEVGIPAEVTPEERDLGDLARQLTIALAGGADTALAEAFHVYQRSRYRDFFIIPDTDFQRLLQAQEQVGNQPGPQVVVARVNRAPITFGRVKQALAVKRAFLEVRLAEQQQGADAALPEQRSRFQEAMYWYRQQLAQLDQRWHETLEELAEDVLVQRWMQQEQVPLGDVLAVHRVVAGRMVGGYLAFLNRFNLDDAGAKDLLEVFLRREQLLLWLALRPSETLEKWRKDQMKKKPKVEIEYPKVPSGQRGTGRPGVWP